MNEIVLQVLAAFILDITIADPAFFPHPVKTVGFLITKAENILRRFLKGRLEYFGGLILTFIIVALSYFSVYLILSFAGRVLIFLNMIMGAYFIYTSIACRELADRAKDVFKNLNEGQLELARKNLSGLVGRDTYNLSFEDVGRAVIETIAENINDAVVAPLFFAFLGGAPLAFAYRAANTLDSMVGYKNEKYEKFGFVSAKLDDILSFIPARITGLLFVAAALVFRKDLGGCVKTMFKDSRKHLSPNSGISEAAMAGALGVELGGLSFYGGSPVFRSKLGNPIRPITFDCILEAVKIHYAISLFALLLFVGVSLIFVSWGF